MPPFYNRLSVLHIHKNFVRFWFRCIPILNWYSKRKTLSAKKNSSVNCQSLGLPKPTPKSPNGQFSTKLISLQNKIGQKFSKKSSLKDRIRNYPLINIANALNFGHVIQNRPGRADDFLKHWFTLQITWTSSYGIAVKQNSLMIISSWLMKCRNH